MAVLPSAPASRHAFDRDAVSTISARGSDRGNFGLSDCDAFAILRVRAARHTQYHPNILNNSRDSI